MQFQFLRYDNFRNEIWLIVFEKRLSERLKTLFCGQKMAG